MGVAFLHGQRGRAKIATGNFSITDRSADIVIDSVGFLPHTIILVANQSTTVKNNYTTCSLFKRQDDVNIYVSFTSGSSSYKGCCDKIDDSEGTILQLNNNGFVIDASNLDSAVSDTSRQVYFMTGEWIYYCVG